MADLFENPLGLDGFEFIEFSAPAKGVLEPVFAAMGFTCVARHRSKDVTYLYGCVFNTELRRLVKQLSPGWSLKFLVEVGVPALDVLEAFESATQRMNDPDGLMLRSDSEAEQYLGILEFIEYALLNRKPMEKERLVLKLDSLKTRIGNARALELQDRLENIYREIRSSMLNAM